MSTRELATTTAAAAIRSGLLRPGTPASLYRSITAIRERGTNSSVLVALAAARWPNRTALIDDTGTVTYRDLYARIEVVERLLYHDHGIRPGTPVGVMCRNGIGFIQGVFAATAIGADVILLNTDFNSHALAAALSSHNVRLVLCDAEFTDIIQTADPSATALTPAPGLPASDAPASHLTTSSKLVLLTSGTTGSPKGVPRTPAPAQIIGVASTILNRTGLRTGSRVAIAVPFFHAFGFAMLTLTLTLGGTVLTRRRFDAEATLAQASLHQANAIAAVPIMLSRMLDLPESVRGRNTPTALQVVISGGAPLEPVLGQRFMDNYGDILYNGYGSSEVGIGSFATPIDLRRAPNTVGKPVAGSPVLILDDQDQQVPAGIVGRIFVGGALTFQGYTGGATKPVVAEATSTGDMGYLDKHGCLYIVGREDDMIVSGGENVYPQAVQNALAEHPDILDNAVIGVPDDDYGQRLAAYIVIRRGTTLDDAGIRSYLKHRVSRFEQLRDIHFVADIPRNPTGKIKRHDLGLDSAKPQSTFSVSSGS